MLFWHEGFPTREPQVSMWNLQEKAESVLEKKKKKTLSTISLIFTLQLVSL